MLSSPPPTTIFWSKTWEYSCSCRCISKSARVKKKRERLIWWESKLNSQICRKISLSKLLTLKSWSVYFKSLTRINYSGRANALELLGHNIHWPCLISTSNMLFLLAGKLTLLTGTWPKPGFILNQIFIFLQRYLFSFLKFSWPLTLQNSESGRSYNYGFYTDSKFRTPERESARE